MNQPRQIFGRHPVVIIGAIQALLSLLVSFHVLKPIGLNGPDDVLLVAAVLNAAGGAYLAFGTTETLLAPAIELFKALAALATIYGLNLTGEQSGLAVTTITAVFAMLHMPNTSPQATLGLSGPVLLAPQTAAPTYPVNVDTQPIRTRDEGGYTTVQVLLAVVAAVVLFAVLLWIF